MILKHHFFWFRSVIPERICDEVIAAGMEAKSIRGLTGGLEKTKLDDTGLKNLKKKRNSHIAWMNHPWLYNLFVPYVLDANKQAGWNYEIEKSEDCQFTIYKGDDEQHYDWHADCKEEPYKENGLMRKLSVTVSLSDPKDYIGGELEFDYRDNDPAYPRHTHVCKEILPKGSLVVFPSFVWHRVRPVLRGTRMSLVIWNLGKPWK